MEHSNKQDTNIKHFNILQHKQERFILFLLHLLTLIPRWCIVPRAGAILSHSSQSLFID